MTGDTLGDIKHTQPNTDEPFGTHLVYRRGPVVIADGGRNECDAETLGTIDHVGPIGEQAAHNRVFDRGDTK
ncbi:hypothetical protein [Halocatena halophila]|uniref:hypothetical protein n=1 Tax=Halocatena halophila TaxID=2814576 RepID=UPI002ED40352